MKHNINLIRLIILFAITTALLALVSCDVITNVLGSIDSSLQTAETEESIPEDYPENNGTQFESESEDISESFTESATETSSISQTEDASESEIEEDPQYKNTSLPFVAHCDFIGEETVGKTIHSKSTHNCVLNGYSTDRSSLLRLSGWCIIEGGVSKYVWSMDGGKTWNDIGGNRNYGNSAMIDAAQNALDYTFESDFTRVNAHFQGCGTLVIDLYDYCGETVNIIIGAVPQDDESSVAILFHITNLQCN